MTFGRIDHKWLELASKCGSIDQFQEMTDAKANLNTVNPFDYLCLQLRETAGVFKRDNLKAVDLSPDDRDVLAKITKAANTILSIKQIRDYASDKISKEDLSLLKNLHILEEPGNSSSQSDVLVASQDQSAPDPLKEPRDAHPDVELLRSDKKSGLSRFLRLHGELANSDQDEIKSNFKESLRIIERDPRLANIYCDFLENLPLGNTSLLTSSAQKMKDLNSFYHMLDEDGNLFFNFLEKHVSESIIHTFFEQTKKLTPETLYTLIRLDQEEGWISLSPLCDILILLDQNQRGNQRFRELVENKRFLIDFAHLKSSFTLSDKGERLSSAEELVKSFSESNLSAKWLERLTIAACGNPKTALFFLKTLDGPERDKTEKLINSLYIFRLQGFSSFCQGVSDTLIYFNEREIALKYAQTLIDIFIQHSPEIAEAYLDIFREGQIACFRRVIEDFPEPTSALGKTLQKCLISPAPLSPQHLAAMVKLDDPRVSELFNTVGASGIKSSILRLLKRENYEFAGKILNLIEPTATSPKKLTPKEGAMLSLMEAGEIELAEALEKRCDARMEVLLGKVPFFNTQAVRQIVMIFRDLDAIGDRRFKPDPPDRRLNESSNDYLLRLTNYFTNLQISLIQLDGKSSAGFSPNTRMDPIKAFEISYKSKALAEKDIKNLIVNSLMTPSGEMPPALIAMLQANSDFQERLKSLQAHQRDQINVFLDTLKDSGHITSRLSTVVYPPGRAGREIFEIVLGNDKPQQREVCKNIFECLMTPTTQTFENCFAVAPIIQQESSQNGLEQIAEDYISIINKGHLEFKVENGLFDIPHRYPVVIPRKYFTKNDIGLKLKLIREITVASIGGGSEKEKFIGASMGFIRGVANRLISDPGNTINEKSCAPILNDIQSWLQENISIIFEPSESDRAALRFVLYAAGNELDSEEKLKEMYSTIFEKFLKKQGEDVGIRSTVEQQSKTSFDELLHILMELNTGGNCIVVGKMYSKNPLYGQILYGSFINGQKDLIRWLQMNNDRLSRGVRNVVQTRGQTKVGLVTPGHALTYSPGSVDFKLSTTDMDADQNISSLCSPENGLRLDLKTRQHIISSEKLLSAEFISSSLVRDKLLAADPISAGEFWRNFKDCVDLWDFGAERGAEIKKRMHIRLLTTTKAPSIPVLDPNTRNPSVEVLVGFDGMPLFLRKYQNPTGYRIYLSYDIPEFIATPLHAYHPDEFNMNAYRED